MLELALGPFEVPVAEIITEEAIRPVGVIIETEGRERRGAVGGGGRQTVEDPALGEAEPRRHQIAGLHRRRQRALSEIHQQKAARIEDLVGKVAAGLEFGGRQLEVLALGGHVEQGIADGVGAVARALVILAEVAL